MLMLKNPLFGDVGPYRFSSLSAPLCLAISLLFACSVAADDVSSPAVLQLFEARWDTVENRMVDLFVAGYGGMWLPPPSKADSGGLSVGYDVFDRFDLGSARRETLYGTETGLKTLVRKSHQAGINVYTDMILNHNGFRDTSTPGFVAAGDYPGFVTTLPSDIDGDFHGRFETGELNFRLAGLIDIAQEKNHQFIRHPVGPDPLNIPSGSIYDQPDSANARYYPDQDLGGTSVFNPRLNQQVTLYDYNTTDPLQGDAAPDNATGLLMRHMRWMVQEVGVDGFRFDAARHFPRWVFDYVDQSLFLAKKEPLLDGSPQHVFSFSETGYDSYGFLQDFVRKDINPNDLSVIGGNRDALDFNLFGAIRANLSDNGTANDWRNIVNASLDVNDDGLANNGSQGVAFAQSHDEFGSHLNNVAHAYLAMRPGNFNIYMNASQFGPPSIRDFPKEGRGDALGGLYGEAITTLVGIRNSHGRGNYLPRIEEKETLVYEREKSALVVLSNRLDGGFDSRTVQTSFEPGTPLIELTGNAEDPLVDPMDDFPSVVVVKSDQTVDIKVPRNVAPGPNGQFHGNGYLIYGVSGPEGELEFTDGVGTPLSQVIPGGTPTPATNGTTRLNDLTVVTGDSLRLRLQTSAVTLSGGIRDRDADGDTAFFRVDGGLDLNGQSGVDFVTPGDVAYGFENFEDTNQPGFFSVDGNGLYEQLIDTSGLSEGVHFVTARAFRHRNAGTGGDGGPAVFTDFRKAVYVDRLPPEVSVESFEPYGAPYERDLVVRNADGTADSVHVFFNVPAAIDDATLLNAVSAGNQAGPYDRDRFVFGDNDVKSGNYVATLVTFEPTGNYSIMRFPGLSVQTGRGLGVGDLNFDNAFTVVDLEGPVQAFEGILYSQNSRFSPAADADGNGLVDNRDLLLLGGFLQSGGAGTDVLDAYDRILLRRGDVNQSGTTDADDIDLLFANLGGTDWLFDLDGNGIVEADDVTVLVEVFLGTLFGDANLDGTVDGSDFGIWNANKFLAPTGWASGDFNGDGTTDGSDFNVWNARKFQSGTDTQNLPEPSVSVMMYVMCGLFALSRHWRWRDV